MLYFAEPGVSWLCWTLKYLTALKLGVLSVTVLKLLVFHYVVPGDTLLCRIHGCWTALKLVVFNCAEFGGTAFYWTSWYHTVLSPVCTVLQQAEPSGTVLKFGSRSKPVIQRLQQSDESIHPVVYLTVMLGHLPWLLAAEIFRGDGRIMQWVGSNASAKVR